MASNREANLYVLGALNVAFGVVFLLVCGGIVLIWAAEVWARRPIHVPPLFWIIMQSYHIAGIVLALVLIIAGFGLMRNSLWGWWLSVFYAVTTTTLHVAVFQYRCRYETELFAFAVEHTIAVIYPLFLLLMLLTDRLKAWTK